jgi:hypothetical protein
LIVYPQWVLLLWPKVQIKGKIIVSLNELDFLLPNAVGIVFLSFPQEDSVLKLKYILVLLMGMY